MEETKLICKIKELRELKPNKDWANFTKTRIIGEEPKKDLVSILEFFPRLIYRYNKPAFAVLIVFGFITGAFTFAQSSLPGDPVYILKKITEKSRLALASPQDLPTVQLELVNNRLEELAEIAKTNQQAEKLAPAVQEFRANVSKAVEGLANAQNPDVGKIVLETKKIRENKQKIETLGIAVGKTPELENALLTLISREINNLEIRTLTEDQQKKFIEAKTDFENGDYSCALEKIWSINNPQ